ncbi:MAG: hypothetical protein NZL88_11755, partial [Gaiellaceae bacterium]|nr:hypothetical protein [Gaiellaceae bacterium]
MAEAEEALAAAETELRRVESLDRTLAVALEYLERAQERAHRDIAPKLAATVARWLPHATDGRYAEAIVDPQTLSVQVRGHGGTWREASQLSRGTREQIYLLLRLALSEHLVSAGERAPLLFDEVTAHCDAPRRDGILALLHELATERQIIVFSHEEAVRDWAERFLAPPSDRLFVREPVPIA